ncbi:hypothetical protein TcG_09512 [Trypanosoma cruzi]|nr:hypothetical protein TcG_09512 [Trypanosoma cruzi]
MDESRAFSGNYGETMGSEMQIQHDIVPTDQNQLEINHTLKEKSVILPEIGNELEKPIRDIVNSPLYSNDFLLLSYHINKEINDLQTRVRVAKEREKVARENFENTLKKIGQQHLRK